MTTHSQVLSAPTACTLFDLGATTHSQILSAPTARTLFDVGATTPSQVLSAPTARTYVDLGATTHSQVLSAFTARTYVDLGATIHSQKSMNVNLKIKNIYKGVIPDSPPLHTQTDTHTHIIDPIEQYLKMIRIAKLSANGKLDVKWYSS